MTFSAKRVLAQADGLLAKGRAHEALQILTAYLDRNSRNKPVLVKTVELLRSLGRTASATMLLAIGLDEHPDDEDLQRRFTAAIRSSVFRAQGASGAPDWKGVLGQLAPHLIRAMVEGWTKPELIAKPLGTVVVNAHAEALTAGRSLSADQMAGPGIMAFISDPALLALLRHAKPVAPDLETALMVFRSAGLALAEENHPAGPEVVAFFEALAASAFFSEYVMAPAPGEEDRADYLGHRIRQDPSAFTVRDRLAVPVYACFKPLSSLTTGPQTLAAAFPDLWRQQVEEPATEIRIAQDIAAVGDISDRVSTVVRDQYEANPYPRWHALPKRRPTPETLAGHLRRRFGRAAAHAGLDRGDIDILVAGCGTGANVLQTARRFRHGSMTAIDLSRSSLAFACRKSRELGLDQIVYKQCDLLNCDGLGQSFDVIDCIGVIHHMDDPARGLAALVAVLAPGGVMRLAVYSRSGREAVHAVRRFAAERGFKPDLDGIRALRAEVMALPEGAAERDILKSTDFYAASECRDLVMHVQEHCYDVPALRDMVTEAGLELIGFDNFPAHMEEAYQAAYPTDPGHCSWDNVAAFEAAHPEAFSEMYFVWLRRA